MGMPRQLQVNTLPRVGQRTARSMAEQYDRITRRDTFEGLDDIRLRQFERLRRFVGDPGQYQVTPVMSDPLMVVEQHMQTKVFKGRQPVHVVDVVFVVARDGKHTMAGAQVFERLNILDPGLGRTVHQVSGDQDQIRFQCIGLVHHSLEPGCLQQSAGMQVGELHNAQPVEFFRQARQNDLHGLDLRHANRLPHPDSRQAHADQAKGNPQTSPAQQGPSGLTRQRPERNARQIPNQQQQRQQYQAGKCPPQHHKHLTRHFGRRHAAKEGTGDKVVLGDQ